jgi:hypothetical protein
MSASNLNSAKPAGDSTGHVMPYKEKPIEEEEDVQ